MADCNALDAANFIGNIISNTQIFGLLPVHYQDALSDAAFYCRLREYVIEDQMQDVYQHGAAQQLAKVIGVISSVFVTMWVMIQGMKIMNGTMKTPILELGFQAAKMILVLSLVSLTLAETPWITEQVTMFQESIAIFLTGTSTPVDNLIDFNIAATSLIDLVVQDMTGKGGTPGPNIGSNSLMAGWLGQGGPAVTAASLLMMARVAIVFGIMLSPLFLFFILFEKTNALFWQWAKYLLSIFFGMAALSIVTVIALQAMAQYGFLVFLSMLVNQMDAGPLKGFIVAIITGGGSTTSVDVGAGLTRLAMMGAFFTALIIAVPGIVMTYFGAAMNMAAQGLSHAMGGNKPHGAGAQANYGQVQNAQQLNVNNASANHYGAPPTANLSAGSEVLNYQAMHHINNVQQPAVSTASRSYEAGSPGRLANAEGFIATGSAHAAGRVADAGVPAAASSASGYGGAPAVAQSSGVQRVDPSVSYGAAVGAVAANSRGAVAAPVSPAALPGSYAAASAAAAQVSAAAPNPRIGPVQTPVHAYPPMGVSSQRPQEVIDVVSRDVTRSHMSVRPGGSTAVQRPGDRR